MEFSIYAVTGQKRNLEGKTMSVPKEWLSLTDEDGDVIWSINPQAVAFVEHKKPEKLSVVKN
jgi:hypothetical protein